MRHHNLKNGAFKISFEKHDVEIDMKTGKGEIVAFKKTPIISQTMQLHKNTSNWWIYYSDIFGIWSFMKQKNPEFPQDFFFILFSIFLFLHRNIL
jgi:hypothetical protein